MRHLAVLVSVVVLAAVLASGHANPGTAVQDATPGATAGHPIVGT